MFKLEFFLLNLKIDTSLQNPIGQHWPYHIEDWSPHSLNQPFNIVMIRYPTASINHSIVMIGYPMANLNHMVKTIIRDPCV